MKTKIVLLMVLLISGALNAYQYYAACKQKNYEKYLESRYELKDQDVHNLLGIARPHISELTLNSLANHLETTGTKYSKRNSPKQPEFVFVLVGELTFRFNLKGELLSVVQSKL